MAVSIPLPSAGSKAARSIPNDVKYDFESCKNIKRQGGLFQLIKNFSDSLASDVHYVNKDETSVLEVHSTTLRLSSSLLMEM